MNSTPQKQQAWALFNEGKLDEALQICEQIAEGDDADAQILYLLGSCYGGLGRFTEAVEALQGSLQARPDVLPSLFALGGALTRLGRLEEAVECFRSVIAVKPEMAEAHCALADALATLGLTVDAREHYELAKGLRPDMGAPYIGLGKIAGNTESDYVKALAHFETAVNCEPENPAYRCTLGMALTEAGRNDEARASYHEALRLTPDFPDAIGGLARLFNLEGDYEQAKQQIELLRNRKVYNWAAAIAFTSICRHSGDCAEAVEYAEKSLENNMLTRRSIESLHMYTARALDGMDRYDEAWQHFEAGNKTLAQLYDTVAHRLRTEKNIEFFSYSGLLSFPRSTINSKRPIFIVGMPRSGTTLVEQILAAHPSVTGGGELTYISDIVTRLSRETSSKKSWPECVRELGQDDLNHLAHRYLEQLDGISTATERMTDKMPHNFFDLGLIQMLFPEAQVIHCKRDPMDTCLSIYFQNFLSGHPYAKNLYHIGTHHHQYQCLMEHWRHYLSIPVLDVQYEDLVSDPEPVVRQMLEHCNLEWSDACMEHHKVRRSVRTASYDQVRQPMYTRSVGRWRYYESHLDELKKGLELGI